MVRLIGHLTSGINDGDDRRQAEHVTSFDWSNPEMQGLPGISAVVLAGGGAVRYNT